MDSNYTDSKHNITYRAVESLCCTSETTYEIKEIKHNQWFFEDISNSEMKI